MSKEPDSVVTSFGGRTITTLRRDYRAAWKLDEIERVLEWHGEPLAFRLPSLLCGKKPAAEGVDYERSELDYLLFETAVYPLLASIGTPLAQQLSYHLASEANYKVRPWTDVFDDNPFERPERPEPRREIDDWDKDLRLDENGNIRPEIDNLLQIFGRKWFWQDAANHPESPFYGTPGSRFCYDEMTDTPCLLIEPIEERGRYIPQSLLENHEEWFTWVRSTLSRAHHLSLDKFMLWDAVMYMAHQRPFHPVRRYLRSLSWDREPRVLWLAQHILGIEKPTPVQVAMLGRWMISCVARVMEPGCKVDTVLVLCGEQGLMKSSFFRILGGEWFSDSPIEIGHKDSFLQMANTWIYEWSEMGKIIRKKDADDIKANITSSVDTYRAPYERKASAHPRSMVFVGTTNEQEFLNDPSGNRRFWVLPVHKPIDIEKLAALRDQLWAEAVSDYDHGIQWHLTEAEERERQEVNAPYETEADPWLREIVAYLDRRSASGELTTNELLGGPLGLDKKDFTPLAQQRVGKILLDLGYQSRRLGGRKDRRRVWSKP